MTSIQSVKSIQKINKEHTNTTKKRVTVTSWYQLGGKTCSLYSIYRNEMNPHCADFECVGWLLAVELTIMSMTYDCNLFENFFHFQDFFDCFFFSFCICFRRRLISQQKKRLFRVLCMKATSLACLQYLIRKLTLHQILEILVFNIIIYANV